MSRTIKLHRPRFAVARLGPDASVPSWAGGELWSCTRTPAGMTVVCAQDRVPAGIEAERDWRALEVEGPLAFDEVGVLAGITAPLRDAGVSVYVLSVYDTDFVLIPARDVERAVSSLAAAGYAVA